MVLLSIFPPFFKTSPIVSRGHLPMVHRKKEETSGPSLKSCNYAQTSFGLGGPSSFWKPRTRTGPFWKPSFCIVINEHSLCLDFGAIALYNIFIMNYAPRGSSAFSVPGCADSPFSFPWDITFALSPQTRRGLISPDS